MSYWISRHHQVSFLMPGLCLSGIASLFSRPRSGPALLPRTSGTWAFAGSELQLLHCGTKMGQLGTSEACWWLRSRPPQEALSPPIPSWLTLPPPGKPQACASPTQDWNVQYVTPSPPPPVTLIHWAAVSFSNSCLPSSGALPGGCTRAHHRGTPQAQHIGATWESPAG